MNNYIISTYDTMTGTVVDISVSEEVYKACKRTSWTIEKNDKKHWFFEIPFSCLRGADNLENFDEFKDYTSDPGYIDPNEELIECMEMAIDLLEQDEQELIKALFYQNMTLIQYGEKIGLKKDAIAYRRNKVLAKLRELIKNVEEI